MNISLRSTKFTAFFSLTFSHISFKYYINTQNISQSPIHRKAKLFPQHDKFYFLFISFKKGVDISQIHICEISTPFVLLKISVII